MNERRSYYSIEWRDEKNKREKDVSVSKYENSKTSNQESFIT